MPHQLAADRLPLAFAPLRGGDAMGPPKNAEPTGLGEGCGVSLVRLDAPRARPIHQRVIGIRDDYLVPQAFQTLRHPFGFGAGLQQNPHARPRAKELREGGASCVDATIFHHRALVLHDANLTTSAMKIDGTIFHGWLLLFMRLERVTLVELTLPRRGQPAASSHLGWDRLRGGTLATLGW